MVCAHMVPEQEVKGGMKSMDANKIGAKIRALRGAESQKALANSLKISKSALAMYERGKRIPRDEIKIRIAQHFGVSLESIFFAPVEH